MLQDGVCEATPMSPFGQSLAAAANESERPAPWTALRPQAAREPRTRAPLVVVLAGGEGRRIRLFTTLRDGVVVPKQFCRFRDQRTLLATTLDRALRLAPAQQVLAVVLESHREWWEPELRRLPAANVLSQPASRGTGVAILHALARIDHSDRSPNVVVMPSDHDFEDEGAVLLAIARAARAARRHPEDLVLLGIAPTHLDPEYGLIVPGPGTPAHGLRVLAFVEKPTLTTAAQLARSGALWNSFIFAGTGDALYAAFEDAAASVARAYVRGIGAVAREPAWLVELFDGLPDCDFCRDVLQRCANRLRLISVPPCGWTDLGTPARLASWLDRHREAAFWQNSGRVRGTNDPGPAGDWHARSA